MLVPQTALGSSQLGKYLYVVGKGDIAEQHLVSLNVTDGDLVAVVKGMPANSSRPSVPKCSTSSKPSRIGCGKLPA